MTRQATTEAPAGRVSGLGSYAGVAVVLVAAGGIFWYFWNQDDPVSAANDRWLVCSETGRPFQHRIVAGEREPVDSPHSGKKTGYYAEACYWTKDGRVKKKPTWVILNQKLGKEGSTLCPDCGREVKPHNPTPPKELMDAAQ